MNDEEKKKDILKEYGSIADGIDLDEILKEGDDTESWKFYGRDPLVEAGFLKSNTPTWILTTLRMNQPVPSGFKFSEGVDPVIVIDTETKAKRLFGKKDGKDPE